MTEQQNHEPKKISLADAVKQKLAQKKQEQAQAKSQQKHHSGSGPVMKSQHTKKPNNQRKKMGV